MADSEKRFAPSEAKIKRLRDHGVFPRTPMVTSFAASAGACLAFIIVAAQYGDAFRIYFSDSFSSKSALSPIAGAASFFKFLFEAGTTVLAVIAGAVILAGLLQNRFYFTFSNVLRPRRSGQSDGGAGGRLRSFAGGLVCGGIVCFVAGWFLLDIIRYFRETFLPLVIERKYYGSGPVSLAEIKTNFEGALRLLLAVEIEVLRARLGLLAETLLGVLLFTAIIARVMAGVAFQGEHGMTREELEAEIREGEVSPQLREAQRTRGHEQPLKPDSAVSVQDSDKLESDKLRAESETDNS